MKEWSGEDIKRFREKNGLSRRVLGEMVGVTVNCIYQWESGLRRPSKTVGLLLDRIEKELQQEQKGGN